MEDKDRLTGSGILNLQQASESPGGLLRTQNAGPHLQSISKIYDSAGLGAGAQLCIYNKVSGNSDVLFPGPHYGNH